LNNQVQKKRNAYQFDLGLEVACVQFMFDLQVVFAESQLGDFGLQIAAVFL
jgi:hypothetical protein